MLITNRVLVRTKLYILYIHKLLEPIIITGYVLHRTAIVHDLSRQDLSVQPLHTRARMGYQHSLHRSSLELLHCIEVHRKFTDLVDAHSTLVTRVGRILRADYSG